MNAPQSQPNQSLRKKTAARWAAVQCMYRMLVMKDSYDTKRTLAEYLEQLKEESDDKDEKRLALPAEPDMKYLRQLFEGIMEHKVELEPLLESILSEQWKKERMSPILLAILYAAMYELKYNTSLKAPIIINEYTTLAHSYFDDAETGFVNAALDRLAKTLRT